MVTKASCYEICIMDAALNSDPKYVFHTYLQRTSKDGVEGHYPLSSLRSACAQSWQRTPSRSRPKTPPAAEH